LILVKLMTEWLSQVCESDSFWRNGLRTDEVSSCGVLLQADCHLP
jgi:hypothetical protein